MKNWLLTIEKYNAHSLGYFLRRENLDYDVKWRKFQGKSGRWRPREKILKNLASWSGETICFKQYVLRGLLA